MLGNEPRLECRKQQRRGDSSQNTAQHQHLKLRRVFCHAAQNVADAVRNTSPLSAPALSYLIKILSTKFI